MRSRYFVLQSSYLVGDCFKHLLIGLQRRLHKGTSAGVAVIFQHFPKNMSLLTLYFFRINAFIYVPYQLTIFLFKHSKSIPQQIHHYIVLQMSNKTILNRAYPERNSLLLLQSHVQHFSNFQQGHQLTGFLFFLAFTDITVIFTANSCILVARRVEAHLFDLVSLTTLSLGWIDRPEDRLKSGLIPLHLKTGPISAY